MTPKTRDLMNRVIDDQVDSLGRVMRYIWDFRRHDAILLWMLQNNLKGQKLVGWIRENFGLNYLDMIKYILKKIDKDVTTRPIFLGEEYRPR